MKLICGRAVAALVVAAMAVAPVSGPSAADLDIVRHGDHATVTLTAEPPPAGEGLAVRVDTGPLEHGGDLVVADEAGRVLGAVAPFGIVARQRPASAHIPLPEMAERKPRIALQVWVDDPDSRAGRRPPTEAELTGMQIVTIPVN